MTYSFRSRNSLTCLTGNGTCQAVKNKEDVGSKVITTLQSSLQGYLVDATVDLGDWETSNIAPGALISWPEKIPDLFYGCRYTFYAMKVSQSVSQYSKELFFFCVLCSAIGKKNRKFSNHNQCSTK